MLTGSILPGKHAPYRLREETDKDCAATHLPWADTCRNQIRRQTMKKFGKFLFGTLSLAAAAGGIYCLYKNRINKDADFDDFDDFDDDEDEEDDDLTVSADPEDREYVSITITSEESSEEDTAQANEDGADTADTADAAETKAESDGTEPAAE